MKYGYGSDWNWKAFLAGVGFAALLMQLLGCSSTRTVTHRYTEESAVNTEQTEVKTVRPPSRIRPLDQAGVRISRPVEVREYRRPLDTTRVDVTVQPVYEVVATGSDIFIKTVTGEYQIRQSAQGETQKIRFNPSGGVSIAVEGEPEEQTIDEIIERESRNPLERFWRGIWAGPIRLIKWLIGLIVVVLFVYALIRFVPWKRSGR